MKTHIATWLSNISVACIAVGAFQHDFSDFAPGIPVKYAALGIAALAFALSLPIMKGGDQ